LRWPALRAGVNYLTSKNLSQGQGFDAVRSLAENRVPRVEVRPPSAGAELGNVIRFAMVVAIGVWMYIATNGSTSRGGSSEKRQLLPFQMLVQDRTPVEQRMFRELQEGLLEAERRRAERGTWPAVSSLADEGIPPFALDPTAKSGRYEWRLLANGTTINYLGLPQQANQPAWLLLVLEPEPGVPPDQAREDEEHHRLGPNTMLHVSTWVRADGRVASRIVRTPQAEGWTQLYAVGPSAATR
jgi:hypothetical protein